jgi:hypothetical protein
MPTPTGHASSRYNKFAVTDLELQKRARLKAEVAQEMSRALIDNDLLSAAERKQIPRRRGKAHAPAWHKLKNWGWKLPPGVSRTYIAGTPKKPTRTTPRVERRIVNGWPVHSDDRVREFLGAAEFLEWRSKGIGGQFAGKKAGDMSRDELLAAFGYAMHGFHVWRESGLRRDKKYRIGHGSTAKSVTESIKEEPLPSNWLGANGRMAKVVGDSNDRRESR